MSFEDLYTEYIRERDGAELFKSELGFMTYKVNGKECFILNAMVSKKCRKENKLRLMIESLSVTATESGCEYLSANIYLKDAGASATLAAATKIGFRVIAADGNVLLITKDLLGEYNG